MVGLHYKVINVGTLDGPDDNLTTDEYVNGTYIGAGQA
jgi:hypothetical protein